MSDIIEQFEVREQRDIGVPGQIADGSLLTDEDNLPNAGATASGVDTITVGTVSPADPVSVTESVTGETVSVVADTDAATTGPILAAAINANPILRGLGTAVATGAAVAFTTVDPSVDLTFVAGDNTTVAATTAPSEGDEFPFGVPVYRDANGNATQSYPGNSLDGDLVGISIRALNQEAATPYTSSVAYRARTDVRVLRTGRIYVAGGAGTEAAAASAGDPVFIGVQNADDGKFFTTNSADREALSVSLGEWAGPNLIEIKKGL